MSRLLRLIKIITVILKYRLDRLIDPTSLPWPLRILFRLSPSHWLSEPSEPAGKRVRLALEELGPIFIKFGQMLSTRRDLLTTDIAEELAQLQDNVPPFSEQQAINIIESALKQPIDSLFETFDVEPMASASVAQVHAATLPDGKQAVVKVIRPGIEKIIAVDIALMFTLARILQRYFPDGRRLRPVEVVSDYQHTIFDELDLLREAASTSQLRRNFIDSDLLYVPEVYWDYTNTNVFVMERIEGVPVTDVATLEAQNTNMKKLAERGVQIFFTQVFRDSFFHADMHPGNVFVSIENPDEPSYIAIDCAIIGSLSEFDLYYLARNLLAIFHRDYRLVAELHVECGWVPADTPVTEFEATIRTVCEPIFEKPLGEISFAKLLIHLFQTAARFNMQVQPSLVLLQKTLLNIEGLGRQLYPELDLWNTAKPFLEDWLRERYSPTSVLKQLKKYAPGWLEQLPHLPDRVFENLVEGGPSGPQQKNQLQQLDHVQEQLDTYRRRQQSLGWAFALLLVAALAGTGSDNFVIIEQIPPYSWLLAGAAVTLLVFRR